MENNQEPHEIIKYMHAQLGIECMHAPLGIEAVERAP